MPRWSSSVSQQSRFVAMGPGVRRDDGDMRMPKRFRADGDGALRLRLREPIIQRIAGAAHGADRVLLAAGIEQFAQASDMDVDGALIDIDVAAPDAVEQLLAAEDAAGMLEEKFQQAIFGRAEVDG